jgi:hypothetical protein
MRKIFENSAIIFFVAFVAIGLGYSIYSSIFASATKKADIAINNQIEGCQRALARSIIFEQFAREAASARRAQAVTDQKNGDTISAKNNIATAERYESFARRWNDLTVKDCNKEYNQT